MGSKWKYASLGTVVTVHKEVVHPADSPNRPFHHFSIPAYDAGQRPSLELGAEIRSQKFTVPSGAILISRINPRFPRVWLAAPEPSIKSVTSTEFLVIVPENAVDRQFLYYVCCSPQFTAHMQSRVTGTSASHQRVHPDDVLAIQVPVPPLPEQRAIAHILGTLDDKIELNRRMNETLEAMAQALFKSWFVDFDPVVVNAIKAGNPIPDRFAKRAAHYRENPDALGLPEHILRLFPDRFMDSELGPIPEGWEVSRINEISNVTVGGQWGKDKAAKNLVPVICLRGRDMEDLRTIGYAPNAPLRFVKKNAVKKRILKENEVLIAASGEGPCGRPLYCASQINKLYDYPIIYSNFVKRLSTSSPEYAVYLDMFLWRKFEDRSICDYFTGTSVPNLDINGLMHNEAILIPPKIILKLFFHFKMNRLNYLYSNENITIAALRDTLLPKLISGELRVSDVEKILEEVV